MDLRKTLFILPNLFTGSSIFCGFYAILTCTVEATEEDFYRASLLIVYAMFFDTIDGRVARFTKTQSAFGVQLDSLADVVSFGVAPAVLVYRWSLADLGLVGLLAAFAYLVAGTARLARFNVLAMGATGAPKKPGKYILGLPIPGAAGILVSIVVADHSIEGLIPLSPAIILMVVGALSFFMVSTVRFRSFKDLRLSWRTAFFVLFALGSSIGIAVQFHMSVALVWLLTSYIAIGVMESILSLSKRGLARRRESSTDHANSFDDFDEEDELDDEDEEDELLEEETHP
ncbi:MAG: CDP-diacylglycerol--serine O-phosphatidyltransferase [Myxococcales bacterium]|nr:CDP-diacylglycerol--serine O-phosphatidyltransferase [Myxococcales bacterium]